MERVLTFILGGGRGTRLYPLTKHRSEPAVPIAGKYRLIDFPVSNCINSGLRRIYILTQYSSVSLHRHISNTYSFSPFSQGFVTVLAAQQTNDNADWYRGTADALRQNLRYLLEDDCGSVLVLSGDQFYRMDFASLIRTHRESEADVTMACLPVAAEQAPRFGIMQVDAAWRVEKLIEKPQSVSQLAGLKTAPELIANQGVEALGREYLANMGMYLFQRDFLLELLQNEAAAVDLVADVLGPGVRGRRVQAHLFKGYWEDVGSIASYHRANLALAGDETLFDFHSDDGVIYTRMRDLPASRIGKASLEHCHVSDGCVVHNGAKLDHCVIGVRSNIGPNVQMREVVMLGANFFEQPGPAIPVGSESPALGVGEGSVLERCILDKNCRVGRGVKIINRGRVCDADGVNYVIRDGIVVLPGGAVVPDGAVI